VAWEILQRVENGAYADVLLGRRLAHSRLAARDQALVTQVVYGTLTWQGYLDHLVHAFAGRPPEDLDAPVRVVLRMALFQICRLTRVPTFAAVDTAVEIIKGFRGGAAAGFVNAVLRRASRGWQQVQFPARADDPIGYLATRLSHPRWLVERWLAQYGFEQTEELLRANNEPAPTVVRVNHCKIEVQALLRRLRAAGYSAERTAYSPVGIRIEAAGAPEALPGYEDGLFSLQGEAAQLVGFLVGARPGDRVLDACAAPGGKATHLAELMDDHGTIIALDSSIRGLDRVGRMARRLGLSAIKTAVADVAAAALPLSGPFDGALLDAPCSGLGTLRQHPEIKWRRTAHDVEAVAVVQRQLLLRVAEHVRPGGALVYATCTLSLEENEDVLAAFLRERPAFVVDDARALLPEGARLLVGQDKVLRTFPNRHALDGFFAVRLKWGRTHGIVPS
jgi:16S rRNA (cytosine967-C5)-methyltransferase